MPHPPLIVDTDIDGCNDDAFAIHQIIAEGIIPQNITTSTGNAFASESHRHVGSMLARLDLAGQTRVIAGSNRPATWSSAVRAAHSRRREQGTEAFFGALGLPAAASAEVPAEANSIPLDIALNGADAVDYLALGPLSNLSAALDAGLLNTNSLGRVVFSGAAFTVAGNIGDDAEFNVYADPIAFRRVLAAGINDLTIVPLDVTATLTYGLREFRSITASNTVFGEDLRRTKSEAFKANPSYREPAWDLIAALVYLHPEVVRQTVNGVISVESHDEETLGRTRVDPSTADTRTRIVLDVDEQRCLDLFAAAYTRRV